METNEGAGGPEPPGESTPKPEPSVPRKRESFLPEVTGIDFPSGRRGYDRRAVDRYVERVSRIVVELEANRSPDAVIERALTDVGEETSAILRRARSAADEIVAEGKAHADRRRQEAEAEAERIRAQVDDYRAEIEAEANRVVADARARAEQEKSAAEAEAQKVREEAERHRAQADTEAKGTVDRARAAADERVNEAAKAADEQRARSDRYRQEIKAEVDSLAQERHRLIEDLRQLADQLHRAADHALERVASPAVAQDEGRQEGARVQSQ